MNKMIIIALALVLLLAACGKEAPAPQTVTVTLASNPTTGFSWQAAQSEELFKIESSYAGKDHPEVLLHPVSNQYHIVYRKLYLLDTKYPVLLIHPPSQYHYQKQIHDPKWHRGYPPPSDA